MSSNRLCTRCLQSQPSSYYLKNVESNTYFKTCSTCRDRDKARRRSTLQRSPFGPSHMQAEVAEPSISLFIIESFCYVLILFLDSQIIDVNHIPNNQCPDNGNLIGANTNLIDENAGFIGPSVNTSDNINFVHCKGCKKNCHPDLFNDPIRNRLFKQCTNCRRRDFNRRHPESLQNQPTTRPQHSIACAYNI